MTFDLWQEVIHKLLCLLHSRGVYIAIASWLVKLFGAAALRFVRDDSTILQCCKAAFQVQLRFAVNQYCTFIDRVAYVSEKRSEEKAFWACQSPRPTAAQFGQVGVGWSSCDKLLAAGYRSRPVVRAFKLRLTHLPGSYGSHRGP